MAAGNEITFVTHTHYDEYGPNPNATEPGHASVNGMSLLTWNEFAHDTGLPVIPVPPSDAPNDDPAVVSALEALKAAVGFSTDISVISDQEKAFYDWLIFKRIRFSELPNAIDGLVGDGYYNEGNIYLNDLRTAFGVPIPATGHALMDDVLLAAINASYARSPVFTVWGICFSRWGKMMLQADFTKPSAFGHGKIIGDGRAKRISSVIRWALEEFGWPAMADLFSVPATEPPTA